MCRSCLGVQSDAGRRGASTWNDLSPRLQSTRHAGMYTLNHAPPPVAMHTIQGTSEALEKAESLSRQCQEMEPKLGSKSFVILVKALLSQVSRTPCHTPFTEGGLSQNKGREALSLLGRLEQDQLLFPQVWVGRILTFTYT